MMGKHADTLVIDQKRIFIGAMRGPAVLHHAKKPRGDLILHAIVEQNDAIIYILLKSVARQLTLAAFARDDRGNGFFLEPCKQTAELAAQDARIATAPEQVFDGVQDDSFCADRVIAWPSRTNSPSRS